MDTIILGIESSCDDTSAAVIKNGVLLSPATALASNVLPVPGLPTRSTPYGILAPSSVNI